MIDDKLIRQLNSPNIEQRKAAITALAKSKNREALSYLANVYRSDADPDVRELARKAGVYIKNNAPADSGVSAGGSKVKYAYEDDDAEDGYGSAAYAVDDAEDEYDDDELAETGAAVTISAADEERANGLVQQALDIHMRGNNAKATKYLAQAFGKNPNLRRDSYTMSLAATITGLAGPQAVAYILEEGGGKAKRGEKGKRASGGIGGGEATWGDALIDLAIFWLVNVGIIAAGLFLLIGSVASLLTSLAEQPMDPESAQLFAAMDTESVLESLSALAVPSVLGYAAAVATALLIYQLIFYLAIHFVALGMLGGDGSMPDLIRSTTLFYTFATPVYYVLLFFGAFLLPILDSRYVTHALILNLALPVVFLFLMAQRIGVAYRFGTGRGCGALLLASIALAICGCMLSFGISAALIPPVDPSGFSSF